MVSGATALPLIHAGALGEQIHIGRMPEEARFKALDPSSEWDTRLKPSGGLWTSSRNARGATGWVEWCRSEDFCDASALDWWTVVPEPDVSVAVVDNAADIAALVEAFPLPTGYADTPYLPPRVLDFHAMLAAGISALRVTEQGHWETRYDGPTGLNTNAWDCESTVWFRWCFTSIERAQKDETP